MSDELRSVPQWARVTTFILSLIGLALSIYLTATHFEKALLVCTDNGFINCAKVTTSAQSRFLGVPVAFLGLGTYLIMTVINSPWGWNIRARWVHVFRFAYAWVSLLFILWLLYAEFVIIKNICIYCTCVHVTTFLLLVVLTIVSPRQLGWEGSRAR